MTHLLALPCPAAEQELVAWLTSAHPSGHPEVAGERSVLSRHAFLAQVATLGLLLDAAELGHSPWRDSVVLAAEDPLDIARGLLAAWSRQVRVVLPANLRPSTIQEVARADAASCPSARSLIWTTEILGTAPGHAVQQAASALIDQWKTPPQVAENVVLLSAYTSGTTGAPERHDKSARQLLGEAQMQAENFFRPAQLGAVVCSIPAHHLYGLLFGVLAPLYAAVPLSAAGPGPRPSLQELSRDLAHPALISVPAHLHSLLRTAPEVLQRFDCAFSSSAPLPPEVGEAVCAVHSKMTLIEVWGSTETGGAGFRRNDPGGLWRPLPQVAVSSNEDEQLVLHSPFCPRPSGSPYVCQDKVELQATGFRHLGRADGVVKVGGKRISLQDLEARALSCPAIAEAACVTESARGLRGVQILMVVSPSVPARSEADLLAELQSTLRERFDDVVLPRRFRIVDLLPRTSTGKVNRQALLQLFQRGGSPAPTSGSNQGSPA